jgi:hypothetical protein
MMEENTQNQELFLHLFLLWIDQQRLDVKTQNKLIYRFFQYVDMNHELWCFIDHHTIYDFTWYIVDMLLWDLQPEKRLDRQEDTYYSCEYIRMNFLKIIFVKKKTKVTRPCYL